MNNTNTHTTNIWRCQCAKLYNQTIYFFFYLYLSLYLYLYLYLIIYLSLSIYLFICFFIYSSFYLFNHIHECVSLPRSSFLSTNKGAVSSEVWRRTASRLHDSPSCFQSHKKESSMSCCCRCQIHNYQQSQQGDLSGDKENKLSRWSTAKKQG